MHSKPKITEVEKFQVVGLVYRGPMKAMNTIPQLWEEFNRRVGEISNRSDERISYGIFFMTPEQVKKSEITYLAAVAVKDFVDVPHGMMSKDIPGGQYASLTHTGPVSKIAGSIDYLFKTWINNSVYVLDDRPGFEMYDQRFNLQEADSQFEIFAPIRKH